MVTNVGSTEDAFNAFGCKLEQLKASIHVFRHGFQNVGDIDAEAYLIGLQAAAESLWDQFDDLQHKVEHPPKPQPEV